MGGGVGEGGLQRNKMHKQRNRNKIRRLGVAESKEERIEKTKQNVKAV